MLADLFVVFQNFIHFGLENDLEMETQVGIHPHLFLHPVIWHRYLALTRDAAKSRIFHTDWSTIQMTGDRKPSSARFVSGHDFLKFENRD